VDRQYVPDVDARLRRDLGLESRDELLELLQIDFRWVEPAYVGPSLADETTGRRRDVWGVEYHWIEAGHGGQWEPVAFPLAKVDDPAALDDYPWPKLDWFDFEAVDMQLQQYRDYAIMTAPPVASPGVLATIQFLLGMERTLTDMLVQAALTNIKASDVYSEWFVWVGYYDGPAGIFRISRSLQMDKLSEMLTR